MARSINGTTGVFATAKVVFQSAGTVIETSAAALAVSSEALVSLANTALLHAEDLRLTTQSELYVERKVKDLELARKLVDATKASADAAGDAELKAALELIEKNRSK